MNKTIQQMIFSFEEEKDFYGSVSIEQIKNTEKVLGVSFPSKYISFVEKYGSGGICGVNILGVEGDRGASVLATTENYRKLGLREDLIVLEDLGEFIMCSDTGSKEQIFYWDSVQKIESFRYQNFDDYLEDTFREAISNW
ncbi:MAG: SMI1/KNR4 family protein [Bacillota bacterium]